MIYLSTLYKDGQPEKFEIKINIMTFWHAPHNCNGTQKLSWLIDTIQFNIQLFHTDMTLILVEII